MGRWRAQLEQRREDLVDDIEDRARRRAGPSPTSPTSSRHSPPPGPLGIPTPTPVPRSKTICAATCGPPCGRPTATPCTSASAITTRRHGGRGQPTIESPSPSPASPPSTPAPPTSDSASIGFGRRRQPRRSRPSHPGRRVARPAQPRPARPYRRDSRHARGVDDVGPRPARSKEESVIELDHDGRRSLEPRLARCATVRPQPLSRSTAPSGTTSSHPHRAAGRSQHRAVARPSSRRPRQGRTQHRALIRPLGLGIRRSGLGERPQSDVSTSPRAAPAAHLTGSHVAAAGPPGRCGAPGALRLLRPVPSGVDFVRFGRRSVRQDDPASSLGITYMDLPHPETSRPWSSMATPNSSTCNVSDALRAEHAFWIFVLPFLVLRPPHPPKPSTSET